MAERIEQELLTFYMANETAVGKQDFVKENKRTAENTPTTDMKQRMYQHNNQVHMLKSIDAMNKKNEIIMNQQIQVSTGARSVCLLIFLIFCIRSWTKWQSGTAIGSPEKTRLTDTWSISSGWRKWAC